MHTMILAALLFRPGNSELSSPMPVWLNELRLARGLKPIDPPGQPQLSSIASPTNSQEGAGKISYRAKLIFGGYWIPHAHSAKEDAVAQKSALFKKQLDAAYDDDHFSSALIVAQQTIDGRPAFSSFDADCAALFTRNCASDLERAIPKLSPYQSGDALALWASIIVAHDGKVLPGQYDYIKGLCRSELVSFPGLSAKADWITSDPKQIELASMILLAHFQSFHGFGRALLRKALEMDPGNPLTEYWFTTDYSGPMSLRERHLKALLPLVPEGEVKEGYRKQLAYYHQKATDETPTP
jgi:hypothetical protein